MIDWHQRLRISRGTYFRFEGKQIHAYASVSANGLRIAPNYFDAVKAFATVDGETVSPEEAYAALCAAWGDDVERDELARMVEGFLQAGLLTAEQHVPREERFAAPMVHLDMLRDPQRVLSYRAAIRRAVPGKRVAEVGCGSGILSVFAAQAGAAHVYAVEETQIIELAKQIAAANGVADKITFLAGNSHDVDLPEDVDVLIHELIGQDPLDENMSDIVADASERWLAEDGIALPSSLEIIGLPVQLRAAGTPARDRHTDEVRELGELYGVDLGPLGAMLPVPPVSSIFSTAGIDSYLGEELLIAQLRFGHGGGDNISSGRITTRITSDGSLDAVLMFFRAHLDAQTVLSSSPFEEPTHWGWRLMRLPASQRVRAGDEIAFVAEATKDGTATFVELRIA